MKNEIDYCKELDLEVERNIKERKFNETAVNRFISRYNLDKEKKMNELCARWEKGDPEASLILTMLVSNPIRQKFHEKRQLSIIKEYCDKIEETFVQLPSSRSKNSVYLNNGKITNRNPHNYTKSMDAKIGSNTFVIAKFIKEDGGNQKNTFSEFMRALDEGIKNPSVKLFCIIEGGYIQGERNLELLSKYNGATNIFICTDLNELDLEDFREFVRGG